MSSSEQLTDIWFVPPSSDSAWFSRLDWYLNWQMCKGQAHETAIPAAELFRIGEDHNLKIISPKPLPASAPLMVSGAGLIPAKTCVMLPYKGELKDWLEKAKAVAFDFQAVSARVYLPNGATTAKAVGYWEKLTGTCTAEFIEDTREFA